MNIRSNIQVGRMVNVEAPDFVGKGGLQGDQLAYVPSRVPATAMVAGVKLTVDGVERTARAVAASGYVERMQVVSLEPLLSV